MSSFTLTLLFLAIAAAAAAKEYEVGDAVGWRIPAANETELYTTWASRRRFHIGDSLRFRYSTSSVVQVEKWGFYHCDPSHPISYFNDGNTVVNLDKEGTIYFISGDLDRCNQGQKMIVKVKNGHHFPPSIAYPPRSSYEATSPSPSQVLGFGASSDSGPAVMVSASVMACFVALAGLGLCMVQL
ncbi:hypothetical protein R6Q57_000130 [Mikania cordata]